MNCQKASNLLGALVFGDVADAALEQALLAHLASCDACRSAHDEMQATVALVREGLERGPVPVLDPSRRAAITAVASGQRKAASAVVAPVPVVWRVLFQAAAVVAVLALLAGLLLPSLKRAKSMAFLGAVKGDVRMDERAGWEIPRGQGNEGELADFDELQSGRAPADAPASEVAESGDYGSYYKADEAKKMKKEAAAPIGGRTDGTASVTRSLRPVADPAREPNARDEKDMSGLVGDRRRQEESTRGAAGTTLTASLPEPAAPAKPKATATPRSPSPTSPSPSPVVTFDDSMAVNGTATYADGRVRTALVPTGGEEPSPRKSGELDFRSTVKHLEDGGDAAEAQWSERPASTVVQAASGDTMEVEFEARGKLSLVAKDGEEAFDAEAEKMVVLTETGTRLVVLPEAGLKGEVGNDLKEQDEDNEGQGEQVLTEPDTAPVFRAWPVNPFVMTRDDAFSTFSLDTDTASYTMARNYLRRGVPPPPAAVRVEEFVNSFNYNYPRATSKVFNVFSEAGAAPFGKGLVLLKVGVQGRIVGREGRKPAHLVFVVDTSGSMARPDRLPMVQYSLELLAGELGENDRISLVTYGNEPRLVLDEVSAAERDTIRTVLRSLQCGGATNLLAGIRLGYEQAAKVFRAGRINRIILCSDGAANVGATQAEELLADVAQFRHQGISFTSVGFGIGTYNDDILEQLANKGDGAYVFIDSKAEARRLFVEQLSATIQMIAKDAKIQVEFNPARVRRYRLIGYENRDIADEDFRNDAVDAGEVGSGQSATALYELELLPGPASGEAADLGTVYIRYRDLDADKVQEQAYRLSNPIIRPRSPADSPRFYLAACVAEFAELLRHSEHARDGSLQDVVHCLDQVRVQLPLDNQVEEVLAMVRRADELM